MSRLISVELAFEDARGPQFVSRVVEVPDGVYLGDALRSAAKGAIEELMCGPQRSADDEL